MTTKFIECKASDCQRNAHRHENGRIGYCSLHYQRFNKYGDASFVKPVSSPALDWIESNKNHVGDECLTWPFHISKDGYGRVHHRGGSLTTASRLMCIVANGEPPEPHHEAAHSCGKGDQGCVNPEHLYWATSKQNHADKIIHGTTNRGERQGRSKLSEEDVVVIRKHLMAKCSQQSLANDYGVNQSAISYIKTKRRWGWLGDS